MMRTYDAITSLNLNDRSLLVIKVKATKFAIEYFQNSDNCFLFESIFSIFILLYSVFYVGLHCKNVTFY